MSRPLALLFCALIFSPGTVALGQEPTDESPYARLELERAVADLHHARYVVYPRQVRLLEHQIYLRKAEIASLKRRLAEWEPLDRFRDSRPLFITIENTRLVLLEAQFDLEQLEQELFDLHRYTRMRLSRRVYP
ncbi:MAG: hypothetical protein ACR2NU_12560 [Aeoliella sp.]